MAAWLWGLRGVCLGRRGAGVTLSVTVFVFPLTPVPLRGRQGRRALVHPAVTLGTVTAPFKWLVTPARVGTVPCSGQSWGLGLKHRQGEFVLVPLSSAEGQGIPFLQETAGVGDVLKCSPSLHM